ncbi:MAG: ABC transporter substrate-binding protein [Alphaproteobacteria bacterium]|nr:ABC transporter substrate-binding protein [Alphaproteobacteria bacterium]
MKIKYFLQLIILFFSCVLFSPLANAEDFSSEEARQWTDQKGQQILEILTLPDRTKKYAQLDELLFNDVDLDYASRFVVGKYWRKMTPEQQEKYKELFKSYTSALYKVYPTKLNRGAVTYTIDKVIKDKDSQYVHCTIFIESVEKNVDDDSKGGIHVVFRLVKNDGKIRIRDLQITESGFLRAYRERFYKMIHEDNDDDIEWFLDDLKELTADMEKEIAEKTAQ